MSISSTPRSSLLSTRTTTAAAPVFTRWQPKWCLLLWLLWVEAVKSDLISAREQLRRHEQQQQQHDSTHRHSLLRQDHHGGNSPEPSSDVQTKWIEQPLDHFRLSDGRSFSQRYFVSHRHVRPTPSASSSTYAFLCVGGEGPALDKSVLVDSVHCTGDMLELAAKLYQQSNQTSIYLYALEHRYYGKSYPTFSRTIQNTNGTITQPQESPVTNQNLVYLSSRQAQADLAHFVSEREKDHSLPTVGTKKTQWVTFGGSYPGMMAAWARLRFPHLITAAVSSSAPIQPKLDFGAYNNHVGQVLQMTNVGGSSACYDIVRQGHEALSQVLSSDNRTKKEQVALAFSVCEPSTVFDNPSNAAQFLGDGVIGIGTQGNDPACSKPLCSIAKRCAALIHYSQDLGKSPMESLQLMAQEQRKVHKETECSDMSWDQTLEFLANPIQAQAGGLRSWLWQTCTEFGFYQTCHVNSTCPFGQGWHTLKEDYEICERAFGVAPAQVRRAIQETLGYYGGRNLAATRILSVNGDVDPWSELALRHSHGRSLPTLVVAGASHHFWTHASKSSDEAPVVAARQVIHQTVMNWLREAEEEVEHDGESIATS
mmetsp:Transcript_8248/g.18591  ORF Transcript_8248/g.18591 Transcript_8248/m.18591 type:complete len:596 (-) Transcript_8248:134-1921(-)